jgi:hypothetical protein
VEKIEQLWEDFEISARLDGLAYAERSFRDNKIHEDFIQQFAERFKKKYFANYVPEPSSNNQHSVPKNETSPSTPTTQSWADEVIAKEFPEPEKKRKVKHDPRVVKKNIAKELIIDFLHNDQNKRRGFKISDIYEQVEWVHHFAERSMRTYLNELYKACRVKMWRKPVIQPKGQKVYHFLYTAATNPNPNFTLWVEK